MATDDMAKSTERFSPRSRPCYSLSLSHALSLAGSLRSTGRQTRQTRFTSSTYRMNLPRKKPIKTAAMTTRSDGRELAVASRPIRELELEAVCSDRWTFLNLEPSSWTETERRNDSRTVQTKDTDYKGALLMACFSYSYNRFITFYDPFITSHQSDVSKYKQNSYRTQTVDI